MHYGGREDRQVLGVRNPKVLRNGLWGRIGHDLQGACYQRFEKPQPIGQFVLQIPLCLNDNLLWRNSMNQCQFSQT